MKKAMLSQPMAGKTEEEIIATREKAIKALALYLEPFGASQIVSIVESERSQTKMEAF